MIYTNSYCIAVAGSLFIERSSECVKAMFYHLDHNSLYCRYYFNEVYCCPCSCWTVHSNNLFMQILTALRLQASKQLFCHSDQINVTLLLYLSGLQTCRCAIGWPSIDTCFSTFSSLPSFISIYPTFKVPLLGRKFAPGLMLIWRNKSFDVAW